MALAKKIVSHENDKPVIRNRFYRYIGAHGFKKITLA